jgi:hypothetical protein
VVKQQGGRKGNREARLTRGVGVAAAAAGKAKGRAACAGNGAASGAGPRRVLRQAGQRGPCGLGWRGKERWRRVGLPLLDRDGQLGWAEVLSLGF